MKKESTTKLKPTTLMAIDETLRSVYARNAPDVPDWFRWDKNTFGEPFISEETYIQWLKYYSELMIKHFSK